MLEELVERIHAATRIGGSEAGLQIRLEGILTELLGAYGITYAPAVNETLRSQGLSQVDSTRPDSLFGHVVLDYKSPGLLSSPTELAGAQRQIEDYLNSVTSGAQAVERHGWAGVLWDGASLCFSHFNGRSWTWSDLHTVSEGSLLTLVGTYRALYRKPLTAQLLAVSFGKDSDVARRILSTMCSHLSKPRHRTAMLFREWKRLFEQVSTYGLDQLPTLKAWAVSLGIATKDASQILFAIHSYYALVVKLLTSELLVAVNPGGVRSLCDSMANAAGPEDLYDQLGRLEDGEYWRGYRISNFLEGDFFSWYTNEQSKALADAVQEVAREFLKFEPATAIVKPEAIKDLLKEFYTTLVDEQLRHDLGEYYTPDWLAQRVLRRVGYGGELDVTVLDPACGSGTFLVECIRLIRRRAAEQGVKGRDLLQLLAARVKGIDLNPLAVISARANFVLSVADLVFSVGEDIELPIYLADCINVPLKSRGEDGLEVLGFSLDTEMGRYDFEIPDVLVGAKVLGKVLLACEDAIKGHRTADSFLGAVRALEGAQAIIDGRIEERLRRLFEIVAALEKRDWNRIWCRIVKNSFSPSGFIGEVDLVVGNPPWVRWSRLPETYRECVKDFCNHYGLVSGGGYSGGIESDISTVVLYSAADRWLKVGGRVALLMTWTVFKSASARGFRLGALPDGSGLRVEGIADLRAVQPFPDATNESSIYIAVKVGEARDAAFSETPEEAWIPRGSARVDARADLDEVLEGMSISEGVACPVAEWGSPLWTGDKTAFAEAHALGGRSPYLGSAHRGTISDLARVYWVKVLQYSAETGRALIRTLTREELGKARLVEPVEGAWIEADLLYPLVRGRDLGRYSTSTDGWFQIIPNPHYERVQSEDEFAERYPCAYSYLSNYRELLLRRATYRRYQTHLPFYVIYCVGEYSFRERRVAWMEQQDPGAFRCAVISSDPSSVIPNRLMVPDHKLYFAEAGSNLEAYFVSGYLNSRPVRKWLGGFLHGKQIGTSVLEFTWVPVLDPQDADHQRIGALSADAHRRRVGTADKSLLPIHEEDELAELVRRIASRPRPG